MADTKRTLYEIEVALAKYRDFDFRKNIIAFNVNGWSATLPINHECDMLVCSKSGYNPRHVAENNIRRALWNQPDLDSDIPRYFGDYDSADYDQWGDEELGIHE